MMLLGHGTMCISVVTRKGWIPFHFISIGLVKFFLFCFFWLGFIVVVNNKMQEYNATVGKKKKRFAEKRKNLPLVISVGFVKD